MPTGRPRRAKTKRQHTDTERKEGNLKMTSSATPKRLLSDVSPPTDAMGFLYIVGTGKRTRTNYIQTLHPAAFMDRYYHVFLEAFVDYWIPDDPIDQSFRHNFIMQAKSLVKQNTFINLIQTTFRIYSYRVPIRSQHNTFVDHFQRAVVSALNETIKNCEYSENTTLINDNKLLSSVLDTIVYTFYIDVVSYVSNGNF